jgi:hypothetical protein
MLARLTLTLFAVLCVAVPAHAAKRKVCVEVVLRDGSRTVDDARPGTEAATRRAPGLPLPDLPPPPPPLPAAPSPPPPSPSGAEQDEAPPLQSASPAAHAPSPYVPIGQNSIDYLRRLLEHYVSHEPGFVASRTECADTIRVELYPLRKGWTAFAGYTGNGREERVDQLFPHELSQFAERAALALLYDRPISTTLKRDTVLKADSMRSIQRIHGTHHFLLGLGTDLRLGNLPTAQSDGSATKELRLFTPMSLMTGYQGKFENWALRTMVQLGIGTSRTGLRENLSGGHVDLGGDFGASIDFMRYLNPRGIASLYLGAGATFEVVWFSMIGPHEQGTGADRTTLASGGLDLDLFLGYELMRASWAYFFLEGGLKVPAYVVQKEHEYGSMSSWFPGFSLKIGVGF